jgi:hypothetical protein
MGWSDFVGFFLIFQIKKKEKKRKEEVNNYVMSSQISFLQKKKKNWRISSTIGELFADDYVHIFRYEWTLNELKIS